MENIYASEATVDGQRTLNPTIRVGSTPTACTKFIMGLVM